MSKKYRIRVYIPTKEVGMLMGEAVSAKAFEVANEYQGMNGIISIMDGVCSGDVLKVIISCGVKYFPLDNFSDFIITCPNCGQRIDDSMILLEYDENVLSGYNINCEREDCGCQMANVEFLLD
jgi:hypothetical protein